MPNFLVGWSRSRILRAIFLGTTLGLAVTGQILAADLKIFMAGDESKAYVESEQKSVLSLINNLGLVKK